jgi:hypothetical protein
VQAQSQITTQLLELGGEGIRQLLAATNLGVAPRRPTSLDVSLNPLGHLRKGIGLQLLEEGFEDALKIAVLKQKIGWRRRNGHG